MIKESLGINESNLVDRFIIVHLGLLPGGQKNGGGFDEAASMEELSEYIMYYYDRRDNDTDYEANGSSHYLPSNNHKCIYNDGEAIRFAGLCHALYTFPESLSNHEGNESANVQNGVVDGERENSNFAQEVQLSTCTLIFIPLEESQTKGLFAVVQRPKQGTISSKIGDNVVEPSLLQRYISISHSLFEVIKCGIHPCLNSFDQSKLPSSLAFNTYVEGTNCDTGGTYPGMDELYKRHKQLRQLIERADNSPNPEIHFKDVQEINKLIEELYLFLPINFIRKDLKDFYDWILHEWNSCSSTDQLFVNVLPPLQPLQPEEQNKFLEKSQAVIQKLHSIFSSDTSSRNSSSGTNDESGNKAINSFQNLIGFSAFQDGNHLCTHIKSEFDLSPLQARLLNKYLSTGNRVENGTKTEKSNYSDGRETEVGYYIAPPSTGTFVRYGEEMLIPQLGRIWLPRIFMKNTIPTKAVMYEQGATHFIFYLNCLGDFVQANINDTHPSSTYPIAQSLVDLAFLIEKEVETPEKSSLSSSTVSNNFSRLQHHIGKGVQIVCFDKLKDTCLCLTDKCEMKPATKKHVFGFPFLKDNSILNKEQFTKCISRVFNAMNLEMPIETIPSSLELIHDEMASGEITNNSNEISEICYRLPEDNLWLFMTRDEMKKRELYILFNDNIYFSIKEVLQKANEVCLDFAFVLKHV